MGQYERHRSIVERWKDGKQALHGLMPKAKQKIRLFCTSGKRSGRSSRHDPERQEHSTSGFTEQHGLNRRTASLTGGGFRYFRTAPYLFT